MQAVVVIRKKSPGSFPSNERNLVADILGWNRQAIDRALVGTGWFWLPGGRDSTQAAILVRKLGEHAMQAGVVSESDAAGLQSLPVIDKAAVVDGGFELRGKAHTFKITPETPLSVALVGVRWDGRKLRPYRHHAARPGLIVWQPTGPAGVIWLLEKAGPKGLSWAEGSSLLEQAAAKRLLGLVDDSYRADDVPRPHKKFLKAWTAVGGPPEDYAIILHCTMLRALQTAGAFSRTSKGAFDSSAPLRTYAVKKRSISMPSLYRMAVWGLVATAILLGWWLPRHPGTQVVGVLAGMGALVHALRTLGLWLRLRARPISKIRSMAVGKVHIEGSIEPAMDLVSPMRGVRCVYYKTKHERRGGYNNRGWRTVSLSESPNVPFYLKDATGKVLVDTLGAEFNGLERYTHRISHNERVREWVFGAGMYATIYGFASVETASPAVAALREGLEMNFLASAGEAFDLNFDGVISEPERHIARQALQEHIKADRENLTLRTGMHLKETRREQLIVCSQRGLPLGFVRAIEATAFLGLGICLFLGTFVYPEVFHDVLSVVFSLRYR